MRAVAVRRLTLRVPSGQLAASRQRAEDALYLAAPDETRLMLLRRVDLGRLPPRAETGAWTARAAERLAERRARAVHAAQPGAEAADAVWFRSTDEARALLLLLLAAGRQPAAWFWRLAVPEWRDQPLGAWLTERLRTAAAEPAEELALARAMVAVAQAGRLADVAIALATATLPGMAVPAPAAGPAPRTTHVSDAARLAPILLVRLPSGVRRALRRVIADVPPHNPAALWLARLGLVAAAPELAGQAVPLAAMAEAVVLEVHATIVAEEAPVTHREPVGARRPSVRPAPAEFQAEAAAGPRRRPPEPVARRSDDRARQSEVEAAPVPVEGLHHTVTEPVALGVPLDEQLSRGAGVLLTIRALDRLGLGAHLQRLPRVAALGFGRHLLRYLATRARLPAEDALYALLPAPDSPPDADALRAWRTGLDRWLRRRVRLRLADLTRRRGWLHLVDNQLQVRFPLDAADLRLRRLALDADPNWVPWLGVSVRYHYRDTPLA